MSIYVNNGGVWTISKDVWVNNAGTWVEPQEVYIKDAGVWKILHKTITIASNTNNVNLFTLAGSPTTALRLKVIVNSGVTIGSANAATPSFTIDGFTSGSEILLINNGVIYGAGGFGGSGSTYGGGFVNYPQAGGTALSVSSPVKIQNNGTIAGGGGGGGQGGWGTYTVPVGKSSATYSVGGSGGGGGAGINGGVGGNAGGGGNYAGTAGSAGSSTAGGAGGVSPGTGFYGGAGGALGAVGNTGVGGSYWTAGAAAGSYVVGNANITWEIVGTRIGSVS